MRSILSTSIVVSVCLTIWTTEAALADSLAQAKKGIEAGYLKKDSATNRKDLSGMLSVYAPGATVVHPNGKVVTMDEMQKHLSEILPGVKSIVEHEVVKTVSLKGDTALVQTGKTSTTVTEEPNSHKPQKVVNNVVSEDTWVKVGNKWLIKEIRVLSAKATVNGQPMQER